MAARGKVEKNNFTAGELSPQLRNRADNERYNNGVKTLANFVILPEGGVTRRPGTRFVLPLKTETQAGALIPFRYSASDSYMLVLNGGVFRFIRQGGFIMSGGVPFEVAHVYAGADLENIRWAQEGNVAWLTHRNYPPAVLTRGSSHTSWTFGPLDTIGGPVKAQNLDQAKTIQASATTGTVNLLASTALFQAGHVNSVWRLDESDLSLVANWKPNETIGLPTEAIPGGTVIGNMTTPANFFDGSLATVAVATGTQYAGHTYAPTPTTILAATITANAPGVTNGTWQLYGKVGAAPATATDGTRLASFSSPVGGGGNLVFTLNSSDVTTKWDHIWIACTVSAGTINNLECAQTRFTLGATPILRRYNGNVYEAIAGANSGLTPPTHTEGDVLSETGGTIWRYRHRDRGFVRITAVTDSTHATATVLETLPDSVVSRATYRWWEAAWSGVEGYPEGVLLVDRGLFFWRGRDFWLSTVDAPADFDMTALPDSAIAEQLRSRDGALPSIVWALDNGVIVLGCRDNEVLLRAPGTFEALTSTNIRAPVASKKGSAPHMPAALESGAVFISRSRLALYYAAFDPDSQKLEPIEVSIAGKHLLKGAGGLGIATGLAWQPDPLQVLWGYTGTGTLYGLTLSTEHKIAGMHSHPLTNGIVTACKAIPPSDEGVSEVYAIVVRTINGTNRAYVEQLGPYFSKANETAQGAWFFDCALAYSGPATGVLTGLIHLAGQEVGIITNNAAHARKTVSLAGQVTLDRSDVTSALVGLPIDARVVDLPRNLSAQAGATTRGQRKRATHCFVELLETVGGTIRVNGGRAEQLELTGTLVLGQPPPLFSGMKRKQMIGPLGDEVELELKASDGMPMTLLGLAPDLDVTED